MTVVWVVAFAVLLVVETMTLEFSSLAIALGCLLGAAAAALGLPLGVQIGLATVGSVAGIFLLAPVLRRRLTPPETADPAKQFIGTEAEVVEAIAPPAQGKVKLNGVVWQAESNREVPLGSRVIITELQGTLLTVIAKDQVLRGSQPLAASEPQAETPVRPEIQQDTSH